MEDRSVVPFLFEGEGLVRVVMVDSVPWFVAGDVCRILSIKQTSPAVEPLDDDEKGVTSIHTPGGPQDALIISEGGLYTLILRSRDATKPGTVPHRFRKWVTAEVLPSIRKTGTYAGISGAQADPVRAVPDRTMKQWLDLIREARLLRGKAAAEILWAQSPLPPLPETPLSSRPVDKDADRFHPKSPLTLEQEAEIRARYSAGGIGFIGLAREYGVHVSAIQRAIHRRQFDA